MNISLALERFISFFLRNLLRLNVSDEKIKSLAQFGKFCIVGLSNVLFSYALYLMCLLILEYYRLFPTVDYLISQIISTVISIVWAFYWSYRYVFEKDEHQSWYKSLAKTFTAYGFTGFILSPIFLYIFVEFFGLSQIFAPLLNVILNVPINFLLNKYWAFRSRK